MAGVKTRRRSDSKLSQLVGPGKEFIPSEVPTLQTIIQRGILIRDRMLLEQGSAKTDVHIKDIVLELVFSDSGTMANLKCQIYLHTRGSVKDNEHGPAYVLHSGGGRQEGDAAQGDARDTLWASLPCQVCHKCNSSMQQLSYNGVYPHL